MRRILYTALLGVLLSANAGCLIPMYSSIPAERTEQLIFNSEDLRNLNGFWRRFWFLDQPDHMTPFRTHGGVI